MKQLFLLFVIILLPIRYDVLSNNINQLGFSNEIKAGVKEMDLKKHTFNYFFTEEEYYEIQINQFLEALAMRESSGNWKAINRFGYIGKYQFGGAALKDVGLFPEVNYKTFLKNPEVFSEDLQDSAVITLMRQNKKYLQYYIDKHKNDTIRGVAINEAGVLAAAHLVGCGSVKRFFKSNGRYVAKDANSTSAIDYMQHFNRFEISIN